MIREVASFFVFFFFLILAGRFVIRRVGSQPNLRSNFLS